MMDASTLVWPPGQRKLWQLDQDAGVYLYTNGGRSEAAIATDLVIEKGQSFELPIRYTDVSTAGLIDLSSGYSATWTLQSGQHSGATTVVVPTIGSIVFAGGTEGDAKNITISLSAAETAALTLTRAMHTFVLIQGATKTRLFEGTLTVR